MSEENDARLILLAAKAAGLKVQYSNNYGDFSIGEPYSRGEVRWNPMDDDGDALRLAVKAGLTVAPRNGSNQDIVEVYQNSSLFGTSADGTAEKHESDPMAATRRAIVRAAARIGEKIKNQ